MPDDIITLVGAGSTVFTPGLLRDFASSRVFDGYTINLVDVDTEASDIMARVGRRIAARYGSTMRVESVHDRRSALSGARFVTTTIAVGSAPGWKRDLDIPLKYGINQTVGDSVGPGGVLRALRHIPALLEIAEDVADVAPEALLVNYTNPLTANVRSIAKHTGVNTIGLCHGTMHTRGVLAKELGIADADFHTVFAGLNHLCWLLDVRDGHEDLYPRLRETVAERAGGESAPSLRGEGLQAAVSADLLKTFGLYPAPGDRHVAEFFGGYLPTPPEARELKWGLQGGLDMTIEYINGKSELWDRLRAQADGSEEIEVTRDQEAERLVAILSSLLTGPDHVELAVNLPNDGKIPNLPPTAVVEVPAVVGTSGVMGCAVGRLPDAIAAVLTARADQQELIVDAALTKSRSTAIQALAIDPLVPDSLTAVAILDDAVAADSEHYRSFAA